MKVIGTAEATAVIADYFDLICDTDYAFDESEILRRMNANAVDAEPVKHGKWIVKQTFYKKIPVPHNVWSCSFCGYVRKHGWAATQEGQKPTAVVCEICGARMDKE